MKYNYEPKNRYRFVVDSNLFDSFRVAKVDFCDQIYSSSGLNTLKISLYDDPYSETLSKLMSKVDSPVDDFFINFIDEKGKVTSRYNITSAKLRRVELPTLDYTADGLERHYVFSVSFCYKISIESFKND